MYLLFNQIQLNFIQIGISVLKIKRAYICIPYHALSYGMYLQLFPQWH